MRPQVHGPGRCRAERGRLLAARAGRSRAGHAPCGAAGPRPVIAVFGLAPRLRDHGGRARACRPSWPPGTRPERPPCPASCPGRGWPWPRPRPRAWRARSPTCPRAATRAVGRLCLVGGADALALADCARHFAPLVLDAGSAALGGRSAALADCMVLVASGATEPALAPVAAACLARVGPEPLLVLNGPETRPLERARRAGPAALADGRPAGSRRPRAARRAWAARWRAWRTLCRAGVGREEVWECSSFST